VIHRVTIFIQQQEITNECPQENQSESNRVNSRALVRLLSQIRVSQDDFGEVDVDTSPSSQAKERNDCTSDQLETLINRNLRDRAKFFAFLFDQVETHRIRDFNPSIELVCDPADLENG
jgi:hypothetical protein